MIFDLLTDFVNITIALWVKFTANKVRGELLPDRQRVNHHGISDCCSRNISVNRSSYHTSEE